MNHLVKFKNLLCLNCRSINFKPKIHDFNSLIIFVLLHKQIDLRLTNHAEEGLKSNRKNDF
jgi:hypothetical protein